jgi:hypothetical protein
MFATIPTPESEPAGAPAPSAADRARALAEEQQAVLRRLVEIGMTIAEAVQRRAVAEAEIQAGENGPELLPRKRDPIIAYSRLTRSLRLTQAMQTRIDDRLAALEKDEARSRKIEKEEAEAAVAQARKDILTERRGRVWKVVEPIARERITESLAEEGEDEDDEDEWRLSDYRLACHTLLRDEDVVGDILEIPLGALVERVCKDMDLAPDWNALASQAWAMAEARTGDPRSPFVRLADDDEPPDKAKVLEPA